MKNDQFLKIARIAFLVLAWVVLIVGIIGAIGIFAAGGAPVTLPDGTIAPSVPKYIGIIPLVQSSIGFFIFFTISQVIKTLLEVKACCDKPAA